MRKLFFTFAVLAPLLAPADIPPSTIPASTIPAATVADSTAADSAVADSTVAASTETEAQTVPAIVAAAVTAPAAVAPDRSGSYRGWAEAAATPCAFPTRRARFVTPTDPVMLQISDPAAVDELVFTAISQRLTGRTVYFCCSPYKTRAEVYEFADVLAAIEKLAPFCDGFAPAFRRSGAHYGRINRNIAARFCNAARAGKPDIQLLGELYFGELYSGEVADGHALFTFPGCVGLLGVNLPRGTRKEIYETLKAAGATGVPLIEVLPRGLPPHKRYRHHLVIDIDNDN